MRVDKKGVVYVLWEQYAADAPRPQALGIAVSPDGGDTFTGCWEVPGIAGPSLGTNGGQQGMLTTKLAVGDDGSIAVANGTFLEGKQSRVAFVRGHLAR